jgi:hypothetical protein
VSSLQCLLFVGSAIIPYGSIAFAQNTTSKTLTNTTSPSTSANATGATANKTALLKPGNTVANNVALDTKMLQLEASNKPQDIATLAYIWGYPLVTIAGSYAYYTTKGVPSLGEGPVNTINFARSLSNTSWVQYVSPNVNVLDEYGKRTSCSINTSNSAQILCNAIHGPIWTSLCICWCTVNR